MATNIGLGAAGIVGIGFEALATPGTPLTAANLDKFFPIQSESLKFDQAITKRRVIQGTVDPIGSILSDGSVSGDLTFECYHDVMPYFWYASRAAVTKAANATNGANFDYTVVGTHVACAPYTLTIYVERNGIPFIYGGCVVTSQTYSVTDGVWSVTMSILGQTETSGTAAVTPTLSTSQPYSMGSHTIDISNSTDGALAGVKTVDELSFSIEDNGAPQYRMEGDTGPTFIAFGERMVKASANMDFENRNFYDDYRTITAQTFKHTVTNGTNLESAPAVGTNGLIYTAPTVRLNSYEPNLSGTTDLVRASLEWEADYNASLNSNYQIECINTTEDITVPV